MSWLDKVNVKSFYLYHYKGTDIIDYVATNDYFYMVAEIVQKFDRATDNIPKNNTSKFRFKMQSEADRINIHLTIDDHRIIVCGGLETVKPSEKTANLLAQDPTVNTADYKTRRLKLYDIVRNANVSPKNLSDSLLQSFKTISNKTIIEK